MNRVCTQPTNQRRQHRKSPSFIANAGGHINCVAWVGPWSNSPTSLCIYPKVSKIWFEFLPNRYNCCRGTANAKACGIDKSIVGSNHSSKQLQYPNDLFQTCILFVHVEWTPRVKL